MRCVCNRDPVKYWEAMFRLFCFTALLMCPFASARADFINGSIVFNISTRNMEGSLTDAIDFADLSSSSGSDGFEYFPQGISWGNFRIEARDASGDKLCITSPEFGTFIGDITSDTYVPIPNTSNSAFRGIYASGTFTPGTNSFFDGMLTSYAAELTLPLSYTNGSLAGTSLAFSMYQAVPEPSGVALISLLATVLGIARVRYGRRSAGGTVTAE